MGEIKQGDVALVSLDPARGSEQKGTRPVVIVSGNSYHVSGMMLVCPLTTKIKKYEGDVIIVSNKQNGIDERSEILVGQMRAISRERIMKSIGSITKKELAMIFQGFDLLCDR